MLGEFKGIVYKRAILLAVIFLVIIAMIQVFALTYGLDEFAMKYLAIIYIPLVLISLFQIVFRNDGLYLYSNGLKIIHFGRIREIYYHEIIYFTVVRKWHLNGLSFNFVSASHSPYIRLRLEDESMMDTFLEANNRIIHNLAQHISYIE